MREPEGQHVIDSMNESTAFNLWLKRRRKELGLTQKELAQGARCSTVSIQKIEAGQRVPSAQVAGYLADYLGIPAGERDHFVAFARTSIRPGENGSEPAGIETKDHPWLNGYLRKSNLPAPATAFIGRDSLVEKVRALLLRPGTRLLTLTGPPGVGKTRLSLRVAELLSTRFADGVRFVALAPVEESELVSRAIAQALEVSEGGKPLLSALKDYLRDRRLLLVLDNFEQVIAAGPLLGELLLSAPLLKLLVTSRSLLHVYGEHELQIPPLTLPALDDLPGINELNEYDAIRLFAQRAAAVEPDFELTGETAVNVAEICVKADGLPLAIELAAAQTRHRTLPEITNQLGRALDTLRSDFRDLPARQRTLRGAIGWSYELLDDAERKVFRYLSLFVGGFGPGALEAVSLLGSDECRKLLLQLLEKSLVEKQSHASAPRYGMLETIRQYAQERLAEEPDSLEARRRHARFYLAVAEQAEASFSGPDQIESLAGLDVEYGNIRAALRALEEGGSPEDIYTGLRLCVALHRYWLVRGYLSEGRDYLDRFLSASTFKDRVAAQALRKAGDMARLQCDYGVAQALLGESLRLWRELDDVPGIAQATNDHGLLNFDLGNYLEARRYYEESLAIRRQIGDKRGISMQLNNLGAVAMLLEEYDVASSYYEQSLQLRREMGHTRGVAMSLANLAEIAYTKGDFQGAFGLYKEALTLKWEIGDKWGMLFSLEGLAWLYLSQDKPEPAARILGVYEALRESMGAPIPPTEQKGHDALVGKLRERLGEKALRGSLLKGRGMKPEQAVAYALEAEHC